MESVSWKVSISPDVDLSAIAEVTEGYTGADLQALIYNANLEAVHTAMSLDPSTRTSREAEEEDKKVSYVVLGGHGPIGDGGRQKVVSRADEAALQRRVSRFSCVSLSNSDLPRQWKKILSSDTRTRSRVTETVNTAASRPAKVGYSDEENIHIR